MGNCCGSGRERFDERIYSTRELLCLRALKEIYPRYKFEKAKPDWLTGDEVFMMYCERLGLAVECVKMEDSYLEEGEDWEKFKKRLLTKDNKASQCLYNGVKLVYVPYYEQNLKEFLERQSTCRF